MENTRRYRNWLLKVCYINRRFAAHNNRSYYQHILKSFSHFFRFDSYLVLLSFCYGKRFRRACVQSYFGINTTVCTAHFLQNHCNQEVGAKCILQGQNAVSCSVNVQSWNTSQTHSITLRATYCRPCFIAVQQWKYSSSVL